MSERLQLGDLDDSRIRIFCSYSHHDDQFRQELEAHLSPLVRQNLIRFWSDRRIAASQEWERAIDQMIETADIVLLLISAYFVQSDYCYTRELQRALELDRIGAARVVPIFVRPCEWQGLDFAHLQGLPAGATPIASHNDPQNAWTEVVRGIKTLVTEMRTEREKRCSAPLIHDASSGMYDASAYLRSLAAWRRTAFDGTREVTIQCKANGKVLPVLQALESWRKSTYRFMVLAGAPGSGKTYALKSLASKAASDYLSGIASDPPIFISTRSAGNQPEFGISTVAPEAAAVLAEAIRCGSGVILLDGFDEVSPADGDRILRQVLDFAGRAPKSIRFAFSCRPTHQGSLVREVRQFGSPPMVLDIQPLSDEEMAVWLDRPDLASEAIASDLRQPLALRLYKNAHQGQQSIGRTSLPDLYDDSLRLLLTRVSEFPELRHLPSGSVTSLLLRAADEIFSFGSTTPARLLERAGMSRDRSISLINALISIRFLVLDTREQLNFGHDLSFDYFFARILNNELAESKTAYLSRANLVFGYSVNRFLVPMLLNRAPRELDDTAKAVRHRLIASGRSDRMGGILTSLVTNGDFRAFMKNTKWRSMDGFGEWGPFTQGADGTSAIEGKVRFDGGSPNSRHLSAKAPITGVSWYDAQQFAWWIGGSLPAATMARPVGEVFLWTADWYDEPRALVRLICGVSGENAGANPDVRSSEIAFCLWLP